MKKRLWCTMALFLFLLSACVPAQASQPQAMDTLEAAVLMPTSTLVFTATPAATAILTVTPTPTLTPTTTQTPTPALTETPTPGVDSESRRFFHATNSYSLIPPAEWSHGDFDLRGGTTDGWFPPGSDPVKLNIGTILITIGIDIDKLKKDWAANLEQSAQDFKQVREEHLTTDAGMPYLLWEVTFTAQGQPQRLVYGFYSKGNTSLVVVYLRPSTDGSEYDTAAEETLKTVRLLP